MYGFFFFLSVSRRENCFHYFFQMVMVTFVDVVKKDIYKEASLLSLHPWTSVMEQKVFTVSYYTSIISVLIF